MSTPMNPSVRSSMNYLAVMDANDPEVAGWLSYQKQNEQSAVHQSLQGRRANAACEFLLKQPQFIKWYGDADSAGSQWLKIIGDMGSGKSVLMSFLHDKLLRRSQLQIPQAKVYYYYSQAGNSYVSLLSTFILCLLTDFSAKRKVLSDCYEQARSRGIMKPGTNIKFLQENLTTILSDLDRPIFFAIDGLDEFDWESRKKLLDFLQILSNKAPRLKVVISSRPDDQISKLLGEMPTINILPDASRDAIIVQKAVRDIPYELPSEVQKLIIGALSDLAKGSAIWTSMVVQLLSQRRIKKFSVVKKFLDEIPLPDKLNTLYNDSIALYTQNEPGNKEIATRALKILAVVHRPLSMSELAWAVALGINGDDVRDVESLADIADHDRVVSLIQPFIASIDEADSRRRQVRLVHQSVKDFIVKSLVTHEEGNEPSIERRMEILEAEMLDICVRYLLLDEVDNRPLFSDELLAIEALPQETELFKDNDKPNEYTTNCTWDKWEEGAIHYDPTERGFGEFFVYASCHWVDHFGAITTPSLIDFASIEKLCQPGSTRIHNWIEQNRRPGCALQPRIEFDPSLYDPLSITALFGSTATFRHMIEKSDLKDEKFLPESALRAAEQIVEWGDVARLDLLPLDEKARELVTSKTAAKQVV
ncbi:NACHT domain-containing protein [Pochonia chlamydosporia 170]|uniref:NACHT domain-containing protein n=1 Tax=Pochonia chlamydosporia 170 TaxID=1380566 RepID=A0A179F516_METCM|nr:NACHT domain-containing protein [Pochonia chlamydosporia 170]OAQ60441.1 NACHT domain-containing protein [Pochonia chlamydosporia 170]